MKRLWLLLACGLPLFVLAQEKIELTWDKGVINFANNVAIKDGKSYVVKLSGINSAHHKLILEAKSFELYTPLPEVLKPIMPGITGSVSFDKINEEIANLNTLKNKADMLHKVSKNNPSPELADDILEALYTIFSIGNKSQELLIKKVRDDVSMVATSYDMIKGIISNLTEYKPEEANIYSIILQSGEDFKKNNYLKYLQYIINSCKAKSEVETKSFKSEKDLTDLHLILIDTYSNDTLYNETKTLYNYGSWGLSFSTGFFYTEGLGDQPYYLENRTDGNVAVMKDKRTVEDFSIGAMGHVYYKLYPCLKIGPSLGLSVSPFDGKSRYLLGLSVLIGQEKMVGINIGKAWAKANNLSALVKKDGVGYYLPAGTTIVPQYQSLKSAWFVGLTYNLIATKK
nr:hypothetical protein [Pseudopedobacter sp.]